MQQLERSHSITWWINAAFAPLGIAGGALALADLFANLIEWQGPLNFLVIYWDKYVTDPLHTILNWCSSLVGLPKFAEGFVDYFSLGMILSISAYRSVVLQPETTQLSLTDVLLLTVVNAFFWPITLLLFILVWPAAWLLTKLKAALPQPYAKTIPQSLTIAPTIHREFRTGIILLAAPFALFFLLYLANTSFSKYT